MAANKPAKGKAPSVEFSNPPAATPKKRAPKVKGGAKRLDTPTWMSPEDADALDKKFGNKAGSVESEKQVILPGPEWELFTPKSVEESEPRTEAPKTVDYTPGELGRKYALMNVRSTGKINPEAARINWRALRHKEMYGPAGYSTSQSVSFEPRQVASSLSLGTDSDGTPFVHRGESGKPIMGEELYAVPGKINQEPFYTPEQNRNRAHLKKQLNRANNRGFTTVMTSDEYADSRTIKPTPAELAPPVKPDLSGGTTDELKPDTNARKPNVARPDALSTMLKTAIPNGHKYEVYDDHSVRVAPTNSGRELSEGRLFSPNEQDIKAENFEPTNLHHLVNGEYVPAFTKVTTHYRRTNNNGVPGVIKSGKETHPGTFYEHPETGEINQTFNSPVEAPDTRSAVEKHGSELYDMYGPKKKDQYFSVPSSIKMNWVQSKLREVAGSTHDGDVDALKTQLKSNPDSIHDMFNEHFRVVPQKLAAYRKLVKEGAISPVNIPKRLNLNEGIDTPTRAFSKVTGNFELTSQLNAKERKVLDEQNRSKPVEE